MEANEKSLHDRLNEVDWRMLNLRTERSKLLENSASDAFLEKIAAYKEAQAKLVAEVRVEFPALVMPIMNKSERIQSMAWTQYTPYFCDGDACEFSVNHYDIILNGVSHYEDKKNRNGLTDEDWALTSEMEAVMRKIPENLYEEVFGNHAMVTVSKDGTISISRYDHD